MSNHLLSGSFPEKRLAARLRLLRLHYESKSGHIGGNLSCLDAMLVLFHCALTEDDRFVLSKGHSAGALYTALWSVNRLPDERLQTFGQDGSSLPGHPSGHGVPGLLFPTGSLGHGPSLCAGMALALKRRGKAGRIFCLCSDGEWQEGSCLEALQFAVRQDLDNLVILIDHNGLQGFGTTKDVMGIEDLTPRLEGFGASVASVDGHDPEAILRAVSGPCGPGPRIVLLRTRKGLGLHFEGKLESHYLPLTREQYEEGIRRLHSEVTA